MRPDAAVAASGALTKDKAAGNMFNDVLLKWSEPPEARVPTLNWRLHVFKGDEQQDKPLHIHRQSAFLFGRDRRVADIPVDHPSCSSQHAVLQYRMVDIPGKDGEGPKRVIK